MKVVPLVSALHCKEVSRASVALLSVVVCLLALPAVAHAETLVQLWRGGNLSYPQAVSVNRSDGSCWVVDTNGTEVVHFAEDGTQLSRAGGFDQPFSLSVNFVDGTCWVADTYNGDVVHLAQDGTRIWRGSGFSYPQSISVNTGDNSCWVADTNNSQIVHLDPTGVQAQASGRLLLSLERLREPHGQLLLGGRHQQQPSRPSVPDRHTALSQRGCGLQPPLLRLREPDGQLLLGDGYGEQPGGSPLRGRDPHDAVPGRRLRATPESVSANPTDGSCWVADTGNNQVVHLNSAGTRLSKAGGFLYPLSVSANSTDASCWAADYGNSQVVHLGIASALVAYFSANPKSGPGPARRAVQRRLYGPSTSWSWTFGDGSATSTKQNPYHTYMAAGSYTVSLTVVSSVGLATKTKPGYITVNDPSVVTELWRSDQSLNSPYSVSVNPTDSSVWVADTSNNRVLHLAASGALLLAGEASTFLTPSR